MSNRNWCILWIVSLVVGFVGCRITLHSLSKPLTISKLHPPRTFHVICFKDDKAEIKTHEIAVQNERRFFSSYQEFQKVRTGVLWEKDCRPGGPYTFYIDPRWRADLEKVLTEPIEDNAGSVTIKILSNNPATKEQTIYIDYWNDDYNYYSVYRVDRNGVTPLKYGDLTKGDAFTAAFCGFIYWIIAFVLGRIAIKIALSVMRG